MRNAGAAPPHLLLAAAHVEQDDIDSVVETTLRLDCRRIALGSPPLSEICGHVLGLGGPAPRPAPSGPATPLRRSSRQGMDGMTQT